MNILKLLCRGGVVGYRYYRFRSTLPGSSAAGISVSEWKLTIGGSPTTLVGKTITNIGDSFDASYPMSNVNDGTAETSNASNIGYVPSGTAWDIYVDLVSPAVVTAFLLAPQGNVNTISYNNPVNLTLYGSNDAASWSTLATFSSITSDYPNWNPGTYRSFATGL